MEIKNSIANLKFNFEFLNYESQIQIHCLENFRIFNIIITDPKVCLELLRFSISKFQILSSIIWQK